MVASSFFYSPSSVPWPFHPSVMGIIFGDAHAFLLLSTQQFDMNRGAEGFGNPSEHA
jgi:hypothetical protein